MAQYSTSKKPNFQSAALARKAYSASNISATDAGWVDNRTGEILVAIRGLASKNQGANDATTLPTFTLVLPAKNTYGVGKVLRFTVKSTETLVVDTTGGTPSLGFTLAGTAATRNASYVAAKSSGDKLVFEYTVVAGDVTSNSGNLVAVAGTVTKNGGLIKDANTDIEVAVTAGSLTGILVG